MIQRITVEVSMQYGKTVFVPVDGQAKRLANLVGTKTLTITALAHAEGMGFELWYSPHMPQFTAVQTDAKSLGDLL